MHVANYIVIRLFYLDFRSIPIDLLRQIIYYMNLYIYECLFYLDLRSVSTVIYTDDLLICIYVHMNVYLCFVYIYVYVHMYPHVDPHRVMCLFICFTFTR